MHRLRDPLIRNRIRARCSCHGRDQSGAGTSATGVRERPASALRSQARISHARNRFLETRASWWGLTPTGPHRYTATCGTGNCWRIERHGDAREIVYSWLLPAGPFTFTDQPFAIPDGTYELCVPSARPSFRTDFNRSVRILSSPPDGRRAALRSGVAGYFFARSRARASRILISSPRSTGS